MEKPQKNIDSNKIRTVVGPYLLVRYFLLFLKYSPTFS